MLKRIASVLLVASLPLSAIACGGSVSSEQPSTAAQAATKAPVAQNAHGQVRMIGSALGEVPLRPDQRAQIEQLAADAESRHAPVVAAHKDLANAIAAQVDAGKIDRAALQPKIDAVVNAMGAARDADRAAFEKLHAILDPSQRAAFVDAMKAKGKEMKDRMHAAHGGDHKTAHAGGPMKQWAADLKLTDEQKTQIHDAMKARWQSMHAANKDHMADFKAMHDRHEKMLEAFKGDRFVMDEVAPKQDAATFSSHATKFADGMLGFVETALPILTPEQRTIAAQKIREHAEHEAAH